jgi:hypothetical protein
MINQSPHDHHHKLVPYVSTFIEPILPIQLNAPMMISTFGSEESRLRGSQSMKTF